VSASTRIRRCAPWCSCTAGSLAGTWT
jgi:hypothetical protein